MSILRSIPAFTSAGKPCRCRRDRTWTPRLFLKGGSLVTSCLERGVDRQTVDCGGCGCGGGAEVVSRIGGFGEKVMWLEREERLPMIGGLMWLVTVGDYEILP